MNRIKKILNYLFVKKHVVSENWPVYIEGQDPYKSNFMQYQWIKIPKGYRWL